MDKKISIQYEMPEEYNRLFLEGAGAQWRELSYDSSITRTKRKLNVLLPQGYSEQETYPVLYLLHGIGGDENEWKGAGPEYILGNLMARQRAVKFITVFPNVRTRADDAGNPADTFSLGHFGAFDLFREELEQNVMPFLESKFPIRRERKYTAAAGFSMGGRESLYIGLTRPERFGYIGAFSPTYGIFAYTNNGVTENGLFHRDQFGLPDEYKDNTFLMLTNGDADEVVRKQPEIYHQALTENGTRHLYQIYPGGHDFSVWGQSLYGFAQHVFR